MIERIQQPSDSIDRDAIAELYRAIQKLRPAERALNLSHLDGLSYEEIAGAFGISVNAVGSRLTRARENLARQLKGMLHCHGRV